MKEVFIGPENLLGVESDCGQVQADSRTLSLDNLKNKIRNPKRKLT